MNFPIWPPAASEYAGQVDWLFAFITAIVTLLSVPVFLLLILFAVRYRQGRVINRRPRQNRNVWLETSWAVCSRLR